MWMLRGMLPHTAHLTSSPHPHIQTSPHQTSLTFLLQSRLPSPVSVSHQFQHLGHDYIRSLLVDMQPAVGHANRRQSWESVPHRLDLVRVYPGIPRSGWEQERYWHLDLAQVIGDRVGLDLR
jgi:hypothetical protein